MSRHFGCFYIDGQWTTPLSETTTPIIEAATGQRLGDLPEAGAKEVDLAVAAARAAQPAWEATPAVERADLLERLAEAIERRSKQISEIVSRQNGMPLALSTSANVHAVAGTLRYYAALARGGFADQERPALAYPGTVRLQRRPVGTVAVIVPWNYPLGLTAMKLGPALAAGCTVVLKPAPETSLDAAYLMEAIEDAGLPAGVVNLITGGRQTGDLLVRHAGIDKVSFTGSTAAGRIIGGICGTALKPVTLELGGKSAAVVLNDADLPAVMQGLGFLSFANAGQSCFLNSRVLAPRNLYDAVVDGLAGLARSFVLGNPLDTTTTMGPLVSSRQRDRVEGYIATGRSEGARLVAGGGRPPGQERGWFVEPTVFADVDNAMTVAREEIFGPVVCVIPYDTVADAVDIANDSDYGLAGSVWSADPDRALGVARQIQTGSIGLNMWTLDPGSPFGGWKASGVGKEYGPEGLDAYLDVKSIFVPARPA
ncbi:aldehyde dehydrogenase [Frankia sp. Cas3]|uniref:aldehyde dehydrogenase n=1 Tax=Frankia sp. Cas3 TaxID=3073926 RepID=UPI002AD375EF|nr:aldehyde dehydrogenase [Frankia sp. Cas3]